MFKCSLSLLILGALLLQTTAFNSLSLRALHGCSRRSTPSICVVRSIYGADESPFNSQKGVSTKLASISDQSVSVHFPSSSLLDNLWGNLQSIQVLSWNLYQILNLIQLTLNSIREIFLRLDKHSNLQMTNHQLRGLS